MNQTKLRNIRENLGLTHKQLAEKLGVDRSTVSHWEGGRRVSMPKLLDLALKQVSNEMGISLENKIA